MIELFKLFRKMRQGKFQYLSIKEKHYHRLLYFINYFWNFFNKNKNYNRVLIFRHMKGENMVIFGLKNYNKIINRNTNYYADKQKKKKCYCIYCDVRLDNENFSVEHIQPLSKRGTNSYVNLTVSCIECNNDRGTKDFYTYLYKHNPRFKQNPYIPVE